MKKNNKDMQQEILNQIEREALASLSNQAGRKKKILRLSDGTKMLIPEEILNHYKKDIETAQANPDKYKIKRTQDLDGKQIAMIEWYEWEEGGNSGTIETIFIMLPDIREVIREKKKARKK